jgi:hypothetical protein
MTEPTPAQLNKVLHDILIAVACPTIKDEVQHLIRESVMADFPSASPKARQKLLDGHDAALDWWTWDYLLTADRPPQATFTLGDSSQTIGDQL